MAHTRRSFLAMTAVAGGASLLLPRRGWADASALETTTVRFGKFQVICFAPQYVCEALLRADGFTDVRYVDTTMRTQQEELGAASSISTQTWRSSTPSRSSRP